MKLWHVCCLLLLVFTTLGCVTEQAEAEEQHNGRFEIVCEENLGNGEGWIRVVHDNELNVTIYQSASGYGFASITAIPDKDL